MANAGFLAPNVAKNVLIPHGVKLMFQRDFTGNLIDLGEVTDISVTPSAEFLEYNSNQTGANTLAKRLLTNRGFTIDATLNEITEENLRMAFMTTAGDDVDYDYTQVETFTIPSQLGGDADLDFTLAATPTNTITVLTGPGETATVAGSNWSISGTTLTIINAGSLDVAGETQINVNYTATLPTVEDTRELEFLAASPVNGKLEFQILNNEGGLAQIFVVDDALIAPNGAMATPIDGVQTLPIQITAQKKAGKYGRIYIANA